MTVAIPEKPKIYHITHLRNLAQIIALNGLWSDAKRIELNLDCEIVGMSEIKQRRLQELEVKCNLGTKVGEYVPFYFCPRSIMLYILYRGNHPNLTYRGGQGPVVHLQADLIETVRWAKTLRIPWAFSNFNAGAGYANFYNQLGRLEEINWAAVIATDFSKPEIKDGKQAEFLVFEFFPWELIEKIGVQNERIREQVDTAIRNAVHSPELTCEPSWYF